MTPTELLTKVQNLVKEQEEYVQTLIAETVGMRWGTVNLVANVPQTIILQQPLGSADYEVWRQVYAGDEKTDVTISNKTSGSFDVVAPIDCEFRYLTTKPSIL